MKKVRHSVHFPSQAVSDLEKLSQKYAYIFKESSPPSIMALGALEAHLSMALQAHKAWDFHND